MLAHNPSFWRNPRGSPDFLAYPVAKACMHVLCTVVLRCLGVARSASNCKAAQALGCSRTPGLLISFGRVTCMAQAASVSGLWTLGFLLLCGAWVGVWVSRRPRQPWLGSLVGVFGYGFWFRPSIRGSGLWCVRLGLGFGLHPVIPCLGFGGVRGSVRAPPVPRRLWLGCVVWVCVLGLGFRVRPATPGWGVGVCMCLCARSACTPLLLAGVSGVGVCAWARVAAAPRHSWLRCLGVCVFVCALRLYPATPSWGVRCGCACLGSGLGCAPSLLAGVLGCVCVCVRAPLVPRHSWLGCAVWLWKFGLWFRLRPATRGPKVGVCVCLCAHSACTRPLLAGACAAAVCAGARVSAAPRHSRLGYWGLCMLVLALCLYPATPGWGVRCVRVRLGSGFGCAPPLLAGVFGCVCVRVRAPVVPRHSWRGVRCGGACLGPGFGCAPQLLARVLGFVCVCVRAPLVPRHSWLGCAAWVCLLGLGSRLRPATPGWGVGLCVCLCARSACTPPLLARVCGLSVPAWDRVSAARRHSWLGCWGVCVFVGALGLYPATPGWAMRCGIYVLGLGFRLRPATPCWVVGVCVCLCARSACTPPLLAGVCGVVVCAWARGSAASRHSSPGCSGVCVFACALRLYPATPGGVCRVDVPAWARVLAAPRHSWLGCWGVCVFVGALCLYPATPGMAVRCGYECLFSGFGCAPPLLADGVCVWLCVRSACTPPLLAGVCGVGVCAWARVSAAPRQSLLGIGLCV